jgi:hypothetical protein
MEGGGGGSGGGDPVIPMYKIRYINTSHIHTHRHVRSKRAFCSRIVGSSLETPNTILDVKVLTRHRPVYTGVQDVSPSTRTLFLLFDRNDLGNGVQFLPWNFSTAFFNAFVFPPVSRCQFVRPSGQCWVQGRVPSIHALYFRSIQTSATIAAQFLLLYFWNAPTNKRLRRRSIYCLSSLYSH